MAKNSRLALVKAHQDAEAVLRAATTPDAINAATIKLAEAARALEGATVKPAAGARYYKETTKIEERVEDDGEKAEDEDDDEPESEEAPPSSKPEGAVEDAEDMDGEDMDSEEDMEDDGEKKDAEDEPKKDGKRMAKKAKRMAEPDGEDMDSEDDKREVPKKYPGARASVLGHVRALTGSKDRATMLGKLDALAEKAARYDAIIQRRAQADQGKRTAQLIDQAIRAGKVGPKNAKLLEQLRAMEPKRLSAFLDSMPVLVRREAVAAAVAPDGGVTKVDTLSKQAREVIAAVARTTGKSIEQATAEYVDAYTRAAGR